MGSWNETCMLSGLPIQPGDSCYTVILAENPEVYDICYPTSSYIPLFICRGIYDDYGRLVDIQGEGLEAFLNTWNKHGGVIDLDSEQPVQETSVEDLLNSALEYKLGFARNAGRTTRLRLVYLKADLLDDLTQTLKENDEPYFMRTPLNYLQPAVSGLESAWRRYRDAKRKNDPMLREQLVLGAAIDLEHKSYEVYQGLAFNWVSNPCVRHFVQKGLQDPEYSPELVKMFLHLSEISAILSRLRRSWHLPSGTGSDKDYDPAYSVYSSIFGQYIDALKQENIN